MYKGFCVKPNLSEKEMMRFSEVLLGEGHFNSIEIGYPYGIDNFDALGYERGLKNITDIYKPFVTMHIPSNLDLGHSNNRIHEKIIDEVKRSIDFGLKYNTKIFSIHPGTIGTMDIPLDVRLPINKELIEISKEKKEVALNLTVQSLIVLSDFLEETDAKLGVENVLLPQEIVYTPEQLDHLLDQVNRDNVKALFDSGHSMRCGINPADFVRRLKNELIHVHLSDNDGTCDMHLDLGQAKIDFDALFEVLKEKEYKGSALLEIMFHNIDDLLYSPYHNYL